MIQQLNLPNPAFGPAIAFNPRGGALVAGNILSGNVCPQLGVMPWAEAGGVEQQDRFELFPELSNEHLAGALSARGLEHAAIRIPGQTRPVRSVIEDISEFPLAAMPVIYPGLRNVIHFDKAPEHDGEFIRIRYRASTNIVGLQVGVQRPSGTPGEGCWTEVPEHMDGGLCFYHPTKINNTMGRANYMTGKVAELPRPYLQNLDANGDVISHHWGEWDLSEWESDKVLVKVIPASLIDNEAASWAIDATIGYTSLGASNQAADRWQWMVGGNNGPLVPGAETTVDSLHVGWMRHVSGGGTDVKAALYKSNAAGNSCTDVVANSYNGTPEDISGIAVSGKDWRTHALSGCSLEGITDGVFFSLARSTKYVAWALDAGFTQATGTYGRFGHYTGQTDPPFYTSFPTPDPWTTVQYGNGGEKNSIYITVSGGGSGYTERGTGRGIMRGVGRGI